MAEAAVNFRRVAIAVSLAVALPLLVGFLSAFIHVVTGESVTPAWVHATRIAVTWLTVIAVFAWFVAGHGGALPGPYTIVVVLTWVLSELLAAGTFLFVARFVEIDGPGWTFRLQSVGVTLLRALAGLAVGAGIRRRAG